MEITIASLCPNKEEFLLRGKLLWQLLNRHKEINFRIFGFWFGLLIIFLFSAYTLSELIEKTESAVLITLTGLVYLYLLTTHYISKREYFKHIKLVAQHEAELGPAEVYINAQKITYRDGKQQFSYPLNKVIQFTHYKGYIFILTNRDNLHQSIILNKQDISEQQNQALDTLLYNK
ncbi:hypothetical protein [Pontibacter pudoricolor]|uniref:hypothetical protein n=1 Tax=Pontibacter pudoricolor TaxID=2694930 RepID=UPI001391DA9C|nr:hypothetical protein [Pontibacter pudoricolor]